jgi:prevent-host-death family protein
MCVDCLDLILSDTKVALLKTELVTTLKRRATEIIADLQSERDPILITQHGKPAAYLVDVASYNELNRRLSVVEGIALGEQAIREKRIHTQAEAKRRLAKWLK